MRNRPFRILFLALASLFVTCSITIGIEAQDVELSVVPDVVYKLPDISKLPTESWTFYLVLADKRGRDGIRPIESRVEQLSGGAVVQTTILPESTLAGMRRRNFSVGKEVPKHSLRRAYARDEIFDLRYDFPQMPIHWKIDGVRVTLRLILPDTTELKLTKQISVRYYSQKTSFIFPMKGPGVISQGMWNNGGHSGYGNQYALDVMGLTPNYAAMLKDSEDLNAYATWGREVIAAADGVVVYARNDVPDNGPGANPEDVFSKLPDPMLASAGNAIVISHGNGEFTALMHMQKGSVRVSRHQTVKRGDVIGLIGASGDAFGPHLHFQVQKGPELFKFPSLPVAFENLKAGNLARGAYFDAK